MGIPKQLHQIWIGPDERPDKLIRTWQDKHEDWAHFVWNERAIDNELGWTTDLRKVYDQYIKDERYCGATNVARAIILEQYGGVYVDADMRCRHSLDGAWFMKHDCWISQSPHESSRSQNAAMASTQHGAAIAKYVNELERVGAQDKPIHPSWQTTGAVLFDSVRTWAADNPHIDIGFVPSPAFHPQQKNGAANPALWTYTGIIYADHYFYSTHGRKLPA